MARTVESDNLETTLAKFLLEAIEGHLPEEQVQSTLMSRFGLPEEEARVAQEKARGGVIRAISGSRTSMPDPIADAIGYATFNLVWSTFNQNSFFDKRRTPSRKWLNWKDQQLPRRHS
jgi:hypothetical protein